MTVAAPNPLTGLHIRALIFDMDGTLVDNMAYHYRAWIEFLARHGVCLTAEEFASQNHGTAPEIIRRLLGPTLPDTEVQRLAQQKEAYYREIYKPHLCPVPGAHALLTAARARGLRIALATMGDIANIDFTLDGTHLRPYFDAIVGAENIRRSKPDPEVFLTAAAALDAHPSECLVFEDTFTGIEAARRAGMTTVGLATTHSVAELEGQGLRQVAPDYTTVVLP